MAHIIALLKSSVAAHQQLLQNQHSLQFQPRFAATASGIHTSFRYDTSFATASASPPIFAAPPARIAGAAISNRFTSRLGPPSVSAQATSLRSAASRSFLASLRFATSSQFQSRFAATASGIHASFRYDTSFATAPASPPIFASPPARIGPRLAIASQHDWARRQPPLGQPAFAQQQAGASSKAFASLPPRPTPPLLRRTSAMRAAPSRSLAPRFISPASHP